MDSNYRKSFRLKNKYIPGTVFIKQSLFVFADAEQEQIGM